MEWISINEKPSAYTDVLLTDGEKCWVGYTFSNLDVFLASHPDYRKNRENECGVPFLTEAKPTHWMPLPKELT